MTEIGKLTTTVADDALLMAYVDGELSPQQSAEVEQLVNASPEVAERVALLMSSVLPYSEAFARQAIPPVPDALARNVSALVARHSPVEAAASDSGTSPRKASRPRVAGESESLLVRLFGRPKPGWLAVAFATGAACYGLVLQTDVVNIPRTDGTVQVAALDQNQPSPWVRQAASYQQLYSRDTLNYVTPDLDSVAKTIDDIRHVDGLALRVPDLSSAGLTFKRVQRLHFNNRALIQLVYLPQKGDPVALCIMKETMPDQSVAQANVSGMNVVVWRQAQLGYALIGSPEGIDLNAVARLVTEHSSGQLFSTTVPAPLWVADVRE